MYAISTDVRSCIREELENIDDEVDRPLALLCTKMDMVRSSLNCQQGLELFFTWLYWHELRHLNPSKNYTVQDLVLKDERGNDFKFSPLGIYNENRKRLPKTFPDIEQSYFNKSWAFSDHVQRTYPLLKELVNYIKSKKLENALYDKTVEEDTRKKFWYWLMTPSSSRSGFEISPLLGKMNDSLRTLLGKIGMDKKGLLRALYLMSRNYPYSD
jgi:hypothetical protein